MATYQCDINMFLPQLIISLLCLIHLNLFVNATPPLRACTDNWMETMGYTRPRGDVILKLGSPLEIYCSLNTSSPLAKGYTADDIIFDKGAVTIDKQYVRVINKTTSRLYMENLPITEDVRFYYCYVVKHDSSNDSLLSTTLSSEPVKKIVCMNYVEIGVKPQNVTNFSCVSRNWENLNCTWKEPNNGVLTVYSLFYSIPGTTGATKWYRCPQNEQNTCEWTFYTIPAYIRDVEIINFRIDGHNRLGNITQMFEFDHYAHVIPAPARELSFTATTPHSIYIECNIGIFKNFKKGLVYRVSYAWYLANDWNDEEGKFNSEDAVKSQMPCRNLTIQPCWNVRHYTAKDVDIYDDTVGVNMTNLQYPNIVYDFKIQIKSAVAGDDLWSDPASLYAKTDPCPPYHSPETDVGGFQIYNQNSVFRDVLVFWKDIPPEEQNGNEFKYEITAFEDGVQSTTAPHSLTNSFAKYDNLSLSKSYRFLVKSANVLGSAPYSTELRLPKKDDILPELASFNKVSYGDGIYKLSWQPQNSIYDSIANFTIFWCQSNREYPSPCSSFLNWTHSSVDTVQQNFTLDPNVGYQFAISVNSHNSTSGMLWASCTIFHNRLQKMKYVWVAAVGSYFIHLRWKLECLERTADIKGYNITYCSVDKTDLERCSQPNKTLLVYGDAKTDHANITDLKPFTHYKVAVSIFTNEMLGPPSDDMCNCTLEAAPDMADVHVRIHNITNSSAIIKWNPPSTLNGLLKCYKIFYNNKIMIANDTKAILIGLSSYETYEIRIAACTSLCSETDTVSFQTSTGSPGEVTKIWVEHTTNSTHMKLKWNPPRVTAGPSPIYDVKIQAIQLYKNITFDEFEVARTEADVKIICQLEYSHSAYRFFVRAKNVDNSNTTEVKQYVGAWSVAYSIDCINNVSISIVGKTIIGLSFCVFLVLLVGFLSKKGYLKFQQMKAVEVILPAAFNLDVQIEVNHTNYYEDDNTSREDDYGINYEHKNLDLDQSSNDGVDLGDALSDDLK